MMKVRKMVLSTMFMAIGLILPFFTMQIPQVGSMMLPMHIPVLLCGFFCGGPCGAVVGMILPILRSFLFGAPPMMPTAVLMSVELMVYGLVSGVLYKHFHNKKSHAFGVLVVTMIAGRVVWGISAFLLYSLMGMEFTWKIFVVQAFVNAVPGIVLQLIVIPKLVNSIKVLQLENCWERSKPVSGIKKV